MQNIQKNQQTLNFVIEVTKWIMNDTVMIQIQVVLNYWLWPPYICPQYMSLYVQIFQSKLFSLIINMTTKHYKMNDEKNSTLIFYYSLKWKVK